MVKYLFIYKIYMNHLELFSGTGSFGKVSKKIGYNIVSLDVDGRATITEDILKWDYKNIPKIISV